MALCSLARACHALLYVTLRMANGNALTVAARLEPMAKAGELLVSINLGPDIDPTIFDFEETERPLEKGYGDKR